MVLVLSLVKVLRHTRPKIPKDCSCLSALGGERFLLSTQCAEIQVLAQFFYMPTHVLESSIPDVSLYTPYITPPEVSIFFSIPSFPAYQRQGRLCSFC